MKTNRRNLKAFTIQSCKKLTKAVLREETADNSTAKANKATLGQVPMKSIEDFDD
jgi:hypothetical protein